MRGLTNEDLDFMPEWFGKTPEEGRKKAKEWLKMRQREQMRKTARRDEK